MRMLPIVCLLVCVGTTAPAQSSSVRAPLRPAWAHAVWADPAPASRSERRQEPPLGGFLGPDNEDHRYPGFFVGAGLGLVATLIAVSWCEEAGGSCSTDQTLLLGIPFSVMLGFSGAVLGGLVPK